MIETPQAEKLALSELTPTIEEQPQELSTYQEADVSVPPLPEEREAGIVSDVARFIGKATGIATDAPLKQAMPQPQAKTATPKAEAPKAPQPKKETGLSAWANREILSKKPIVKDKKIGDMVKTVNTPKLKPIEPEMTQAQSDQVKLFDAVERGTSPKFAQFNPQKEAANLVESDIDQFDDTLSHQINFNTLDNEDEVNAVIASMAESNKANIDFERRGVVGDDQIRLLAKDIGADENFIRDVFLREAGGAIPPAEYVVAMRQVLNQSATQLKLLADEVTKTQSPKTQIEFARQFDFHRKFQSKFMGVRAEYGRGLRAMGIPTQGENDVLMTLGAIEKNMDTMKLAQMINDAESAQGINKMVGGYNDNWKYTADVFYTHYMSSMLSGLSTQILNVAGNTVNMGVNMMERKIASLIPRGKNALDDVQNDEVTAMFIGMQSAFGDAMKAGWKTLKDGEPYKGFGVFGEDFSMPLPSEKYNQDNLLGTMMDLSFKALTFPLRNVMGSADSAFKVLNERSQLSALAYREAKGAVRRGEISPDEFQGKLQEMIESPQMAMMSQSEQYSKEMAYQENPGQILTSWSNAISKTPGMRWITPFVKTLGNITRQTLVERSPAAPLSAKFREDFAAGGSRRQIALAKMGMGIGVTSIAIGMANEGRITGPMPKSNAERKAWKEAGIKPFSVVFKDESGANVYVPYTGLEPFATFFGIAASLSDFERKGEFVDLSDGEQEKYSELVSNFMFAVSENTMNKTFAVGLQNFFDATSGNNVAAFTRMMQGYTNTMIPYAGLRRNLTKDYDEVKRKTSGVFDYVQSQIPILSESLPPVRDSFGEEVTHDYTYIRWMPSVGKNDAVSNEVLSLYEKTHKSAMPNVKDILGGQKISPEDSEKWVTFARRDYTDSSGRTLKERIADTIQSEYYQSLISEDKVKHIQKIVQKNDMAALKQLSKDDKELFMRLHAKEIVRSAQKMIEFEQMDADSALEQANEEYEDLFGGQ